MKDKKTCSLEAHQKMEELNTAHGKAAFTLRDQFQHAQVSHPTNAIITPDEQADEDEEEGVEDVEEHNEWFKLEGVDVRMYTAPNPASIRVVDHIDDTEVPCPSKKSDEGNKKIKAQFGWRRTHNEQTLVRPCGIIFARAMMYGAEAVSNFLVWTTRLYISVVLLALRSFSGYGQECVLCSWSSETRTSYI